MSFDKLLNTSPESFVDSVINNAEESGTSEASSTDFEFNTSDHSFGVEEEITSNISDAHIEEEIIEEQPEIESASTAKVHDPYSHLNEGEEESDFLSDIDKKRNYLYCQLYVMMMGEGAELVCKLIAGEWGEDASKKYSVNKTKQNEIAKAWAEILNIEMSKKSPKGALTMLIIANFAPLLFMAIKTRVKNNKAKKAAQAEAKHKQYQAEVFESYEEIIQDDSHILTPQNEHVQKKELVKVDHNGTAMVQKDKVQKTEAFNQGRKTKGRKLGRKKNPATGKYEDPIETLKEGDIPKYWVYSWGLKKKINKTQLKKLGHG